MYLTSFRYEAQNYVYHGKIYHKQLNNGKIRKQGGEQYLRKFFARKFRRYWHIWRSGDRNNFFVQKFEKRVGVRNDVICQTYILIL